MKKYRLNLVDRVELKQFLNVIVNENYMYVIVKRMNTCFSMSYIIFEI